MSGRHFQVAFMGRRWKACRALTQNYPLLLLPGSSQAEAFSPRHPHLL